MEFIRLQRPVFCNDEQHFGPQIVSSIRRSALEMSVDFAKALWPSPGSILECAWADRMVRLKGTDGLVYEVWAEDPWPYMKTREVMFIGIQPCFTTGTCWVHVQCRGFWCCPAGCTIIPPFLWAGRLRKVWVPTDWVQVRKGASGQAPPNSEADKPTYQ